MGVSRTPGLARPRLLFVYGTLRRGFRNPYARALRAQASWLGYASISGRIYDLGRYPGMRLEAAPGANRVIGELYRLPSDPALLGILDAWEGPDYRRIITAAHRPGRPPAPTWVYEYLPRVPESRRIRSGDYLRR